MLIINYSYIYLILYRLLIFILPLFTLVIRVSKADLTLHNFDHLKYSMMQKHNSIVKTAIKIYNASDLPEQEVKKMAFLLQSALIMAKLSCMPYAGHRAYQMIILISKRRKIPFSTKNAFCYTLYHILVKGETFEDRGISDTGVDMIYQDLKQIRDRNGFVFSLDSWPLVS